MRVGRPLRRWIAVLATTAIVGLGTFGLHHLYADALKDEHPSHDCMTCRVVGSANAVAAAKPIAALATCVAAAPSIAPPEIEHPGFTRIHSSRGPPLSELS